MELEIVAKALKELGHPTRLRVYKHLVKSGYNGLPVGKLQEELDIPGSTLSHHISGLVSAGLIEQQRDGRTLYCIPQYDMLDGVVGFLQDECCSSQPPGEEKE
ncbi:ArsR/SmtB family transcription factor [Photobacterium kasasachensis]|uniref:ArsR/SmtB family transcription factor n=1 Tax=Photobacterium kasasachensis TaxID=2910240 RepID=UPI003D0D1F65